LRILVIDDERETCKILTHILKGEGHCVTATTNGRAALNALAESPFDVVFCDLAMPRVSGWDVAAKVKELRLKKATLAPFLVFITGLGMYIDHSQAVEAGVDCVVNKPFLAEEVLDVVEKAKINLGRPLLRA
jgi:CheY-like chemotaxis protein